MDITIEEWNTEKRRKREREREMERGSAGGRSEEGPREDYGWRTSVSVFEDR